MKRFGILLLTVVGLFALMASIGFGQDDDEDDMMMVPENNGLVTIESNHSVTDTMDRLVMMLEDAGFFILARVDHAMNAENNDLELRPTQLLLFGNPNVGTPLMQNSQSTAIDLPQKFLVWEDEDGNVFITYNDPFYLAWRHGIEEMDEVLTNVSNALGNFASQAATEDE